MDRVNKWDDFNALCIVAVVSSVACFITVMAIVCVAHLSKDSKPEQVKTQYIIIGNTRYEKVCGSDNVLYLKAGRELIKVHAEDGTLKDCDYE